MTPVELPIRWIPKRRTHWLAAMVITVVCLALALGIRIWLLGADSTTGVTSSMFPALIVISIYAGWRWALGTVVILGSLTFVGMAFQSISRPAGEWITVALFVASCAVTVILAGAVRELLIRLDEEREARKTAEGHLLESEVRFRALADSAPTLMWVTGQDRNRSLVNRAYIDYLGVPEKQALVFDWRKRLHPDDVDRIMAEQIAGERSRQPFTLEARYARADGEWRWLRSISRPRIGTAGEFEGFIGIAFDVTDAKQAEADLMRINELLAERVEATLAERDQAQAALAQSQKMEAIGQLTGGVAHDFNNLLTVVIGALDIILRHPDDAARRKRMGEAALAAARRGERLTQQLLAFSRKQPLQPANVSIDSLLAEAEPLLRRAVGENIRLTVELDAGGGVTRIDAGQLEAAVLNLVLNARDAISDSGHIALATNKIRVPIARGDTPAGEYLCVSVTDDGVGMEPETRAHAFEPFFTTKSVGKGTGLGLSQVYGFVRQSNGAVEIESAMGHGTTVRLLLPLSHVTEVAVQEGRVKDIPVPESLKVLLVEDDADVAELVEAMLRELGHTVVSAADAHQALNKAASEPELGLMLTDVIMPGGKNGVDLAREMTKLRPGLPVILSSGYTGETLAGAEKAPWPLLRKPYTIEALSKVIAETVHARALH